MQGFRLALRPAKRSRNASVEHAGFGLSPHVKALIVSIAAENIAEYFAAVPSTLLGEDE